MSIKGSLKDFGLRDIIATLGHRKESGRLQISFGSTEGFLYFDKGRLVAAHVSSVSGVSALNLAISMEGSSFTFDPLVEIPPAIFNEHNERRLVNELLRVATVGAKTTIVQDQKCPSGQQISMTAPLLRQPPQPPPLRSQESKIAYDEDGFKLHSVPLRKSLTGVFKKKQIATVGAVSILALGILAAVGVGAYWIKAVTVTADASRERTNPAPIENKGAALGLVGQNNGIQPGTYANVTLPPKIEPTKKARLSAKNQTTTFPTPEVASVENKETAFGNEDPDITPAIGKDKSKGLFKEIGVNVTIERGRVTEAYIKKRAAGAEAYEATALQLARERRFPESRNSRETVVFRVASEQ